MSRLLQAKFTPAFSRDLKKKAAERQWNPAELENEPDLMTNCFVGEWQA